MNLHYSTVAKANLFPNNVSNGLDKYWADLRDVRTSAWVVEARLNLRQLHCLKTTGCLDNTNSARVGDYAWETLAKYLVPDNSVASKLPAKTAITDLCVSGTCCAFKQLKAANVLSSKEYENAQKCISKVNNLLASPISGGNYEYSCVQNEQDLWMEKLALGTAAAAATKSRIARCTEWV